MTNLANDVTWGTFNPYALYHRDNSITGAPFVIPQGEMQAQINYSNISYLGLIDNFNLTDSTFYLFSTATGKVAYYNSDYDLTQTYQYGNAPTNIFDAQDLQRYSLDTNNYAWDFTQFTQQFNLDDLIAKNNTNTNGDGNNNNTTSNSTQSIVERQAPQIASTQNQAGQYLSTDLVFRPGETPPGSIVNLPYKNTGEKPEIQLMGGDYDFKRNGFWGLSNNSDSDDKSTIDDAINKLTPLQLELQLEQKLKEMNEKNNNKPISELNEYHNCITGQCIRLPSNVDPIIAMKIVSNQRDRNTTIYLSETEKYWNDAIYLPYIPDFLAKKVGIKPNAAGIFHSIGAGFLGIDAPKDVVDLGDSLWNWEWTWEHAGNTGINAIGVLPLVGVVKNARHIGKAANALDETKDVIKATEQAGKAGNAASDAVSGAGGYWKTIDEKASSSVVKQLTENSCGNACAEMLLRGKEIYNVTQANIAAFKKRVLSTGKDLAEAMNTLSKSTKGSWIGNTFDIAADPKKYFNYFSSTGPFITSLKSFGSNTHMVVVDGLDKFGRVKIRDPWEGTEYVMEWGEFVIHWMGDTVFWKAAQ